MTGTGTKPDHQGNLIAFNKPYGVLSQFTGERPNLSDFIAVKGFYPAGRLDKDSEGLMLLTSDGDLQARISHPRFKMPKTYWVQLEGEITEDAIASLKAGVTLKDGKTRPANCQIIDSPLPPRDPPIRERQNQPTSWIALEITEGRNRQVRRMTAAVGFPTLRLCRFSIGTWNITDLAQGDYVRLNVNLPRP